LECLLTSTRTDYHISKIRRFEFDPATQDPLQYALRDDPEGNVFHVSKVTDMKGEPKGSRKQLFFEVFWSGYTTPTWEPWATLRRTTALHTYLRNHADSKVRQLLPKGFENAARAAELPSDGEDSDEDSDADNND
jgi:hypothetical protein